MINFKNKRILVVVAHPDDELLGLGGTLHHLIKREKSIVRVVIMGEGITSRSEERNLSKWKNHLSIHKENIKQAQKILGYQELATYSFPDNRFDIVPLLEIVKVVEKEKKSFNPDIVFTHHNGDLNIDHKLTFQAVITAFRPLPNEFFSSIITFETPSGTEWIPSNDLNKFNPNFFIPLFDEDIKAKTKAMECYEFEKREFPHPRSSKALINRAQMWAVTIGSKLAEPFQIIKMISRSNDIS